MTMLFVLLQSTVLLTLGLLAVRLARRRGPAVQSLAGRAALAAVGLLVLLTPLSGHMRAIVGVPEPTPKQVSIRSNAKHTLPTPEGEEVRTVSVGGPGIPLKIAGAGATASGAETGVASSAPTMPAPSAANAHTHALDLLSEHSDPSRFGRGMPAALLRIWYAVPGVGALLLWLALCQWHLTRLRRTARIVPAGSPAAIQLAALTPDPPALLAHPAVHSPFLAGQRRPAIFLPTDYETAFPPDALRAVLVHELAHRDRRDNTWTLAARLLCAVLWFQPLLWLLVRRLEHVSEDACDQAVLVAGCQPRAYADCLLSLATHSPLARRPRTLAAGVAPCRSSVGRRISRILAAKGVPAMTPITPRLRLTAAALSLAAALGGVFLISSAPAQTTAPAPRVSTPQEQQFRAQQKQDLQNLKIIGLALVMYERDNQYKFPSADKWMDQITPYLEQIAEYRQDRSVFYDPFRPGKKRYGYALNRNCSGKSLSAVPNPTETVALFDSTLGTRNASDIGQSLKADPLPPGSTYRAGSSYGFADGHVKWFGQNLRPSFSLKGELPLSSASESRAVQLRKLTAELVGTERAIAGRSNGPLDQARFLAGLTPVQGPGVLVTLTDSKKSFPNSLPPGMTPPSLIHDTDINAVVNELKAAGAEAVAVNGQRLVATSAIRTAGPTVLINNSPQVPPYVIKAIGAPKTLETALNISGGIAAQLKSFDPAMFSVSQAATLTLPAYTGNEEMRYAKPVGQ